MIFEMNSETFPVTETAKVLSRDFWPLIILMLDFFNPQA